MARNANGEGSIRQRADGRWEGRAYVITTDGREIRKSVYGKTWDEVHAKLTKLQADTMSGKRVASTRMTVREYIEFWFVEHASDRNRVRDTTYETYRYLASTYLVPTFGRLRLIRLRPFDIRRGLYKIKQTCQCCAQGKDRARVDRGQAARCCAKTPPECCRFVVSDGTILALHRLLRVILQDAVSQDELLTENVAKGLKLDHTYRPRFRTWTAKEARQFLRTVRDDRLYALYAVALALGLRRGEALGLRWQDVDLDAGIIWVRNTLRRINGQLRLGPTKTDASVRRVAMPKHCVNVLREHRDRQADERKRTGKGWHDTGYVFTSAVGTPIEPRNLNRHFYRLREEASVPHIRFHDLRHSCATLLYGQGVRLDNISDVLGHSSTAITKKIYIEVDDKVKRQTAEQLGFLFDEEVSE